jgi:hypothetical protein
MGFLDDFVHLAKREVTHNTEDTEQSRAKLCDILKVDQRAARRGNAERHLSFLTGNSWVLRSAPLSRYGLIEYQKPSMVDRTGHGLQRPGEA